MAPVINNEIQKIIITRVLGHMRPPIYCVSIWQGSTKICMPCMYTKLKKKNQGGGQEI